MLCGNVTAIVLLGNEIVQLDTTQYSGTVTYYFEIVASSGTTATNVTLRRLGTATDDATIPVTTSSGKTRYRSAAFTPPAGQTEYFVSKSSNNSNSAAVVAARIIMIQNSTTLTSTETQIEIGNNETAKINTVAAALTNAKYWTYTAANWDGTLSFYTEVVWATSAKNTTTITLQEDDGSFASWTDKVTIVSAGTGTVTRTRVAFGFSPTDGRHYRISALGSTSKSNYSIYCAKIIIQQTPTLIDSYALSNQDGMFAIGASSSNPSVVGQSFTGNGGIINSATVMLSKTGSPTGNAVAKIYAHSGTFGTSSVPTGAALATSDTIDVSTLTTTILPRTFSFSGANQITVTNTTKYCLSIEYTSDGGGANYISAGTDGSSPSHAGNAYTDLVSAPTAISVLDVPFLLFSTSGAPTKLEPQYLLLNQADSGSTGLQSYQTLWDSTEWSGVTTSFKYAQDATNASDSSKLQDIDNANADVAGATATGANQQISAAFTMPTTGHQIDVNVTNTTGVVGAGRVLVLVTPAAVAATSTTLNAPTTISPGPAFSDGGSFAF